MVAGASVVGDPVRCTVVCSDQAGDQLVSDWTTSMSTFATSTSTLPLSIARLSFQNVPFVVGRLEPRSRITAIGMNAA